MRKITEILDGYNIPAINALVASIAAIATAVAANGHSTVAVVLGLVAIASAQLA